MKYQVTIKEIEVYVVEVEADSEDEAADCGYDLIEQDRSRFHHDSESGDIIVEEIL